MNKTTRNKLMVLLVIFILFSSSIAFVIIGAYDFSSGEPPQQALNNSVIKGDISQDLQNLYESNGYTFLKYYYTDQSILLQYTESLPYTFRTNDGTYQMFVVEIPSESEYITVSSYRNVVNVDNITTASIFNALCDVVSYRPPDCILGTLNISSV